jgi:hypothetical protein
MQENRLFLTDPSLLCYYEVLSGAGVPPPPPSLLPKSVTVSCLASCHRPVTDCTQKILELQNPVPNIMGRRQTCRNVWIWSVASETQPASGYYGKSLYLFALCRPCVFAAFTGTFCSLTLNHETSNVNPPNVYQLSLFL